MSIRYFQADAFVTDKLFSGNPAGVCILTGPKEDAWMQGLAHEIHQADTAFLYPEGDGWNLRWFTPSLEVPLCGHATLATAHVLFSEGLLGTGKEARFNTKSGPLKASQKDEKIELDFPAKPSKPCEKPAQLEESLGSPVLSFGHNGTQYLAELPSAAAVRGLKPDFKMMESYLDEHLHGIIVTAASDNPAYDFVSRFFAPLAGIPEDPVTGSAHCALGPFWQKRLGKDNFTAFQASARGGILSVRCEGERVYLGGKARTVIKGQLVSE